MQVLEEPGQDTNKYDTLQLTIAHPPHQLGVEHIETSGLLSEPSLSDGSGVDGGDGCGVQLGIIKQFTFSSELQRMSVIVRCLPSRQARHFLVFVKGAPETILHLSRPESVPEDFQDVLANFTHLGFRVLAVGSRDLRQPWHKVERLERSATEVLACIAVPKFQPISSECVRSIDTHTTACCLGRLDSNEGPILGPKHHNKTA